MSKSLTIAKRFAERMVTASGTRSDLRVTDAKDLGDGGSFKIAISYDKYLSVPKASDIRQFVLSTFKGKVTPNMATARVHDEGRHHGITLVASAKRITLKMKYAKDMVPVVACTVFMDTKLGENWNVKTTESGKKYLECAREEDVGKMMNLAVASATSVTAGLRLGSDVVAGATLPEKGDVVKFFADNAQRTGTVNRIKGDEVFVSEEDGNTFVVPCASIIAIVTKNAKSAQEEVDEQAAFYATFLPVEFVREMFPKARI